MLNTKLFRWLYKRERTRLRICNCDDCEKKPAYEASMARYRAQCITRTLWTMAYILATGCIIVIISCHHAKLSGGY